MGSFFAIKTNTQNRKTSGCNIVKGIVIGPISNVPKHKINSRVSIIELKDIIKIKRYAFICIKFLFKKNNNIPHMQ
jgi:hypothetical protein